MSTILSVSQVDLIESARTLLKTGSFSGLLVSGRKYRSALALEAKGYGYVKYQGPSLGWFYLNVSSVRPLNLL